ncbi:MAG TPA: YhcH/YjgK/YiaL family protein [Candidatus Aminicenantes bacterium]|nr:YhcH/YjgK/YiaL family protein [Candidatus Aminicenantes bacterium]
MIVDRLDNWECYFSGDTWKMIFDFIKSLTAESEEKKYVLDGDAIYAGIGTGETKPAEEGKIESHKKYIDIQVPLAGVEGIEWYALDEVEPKTDYDPQKDVILYHRNKPGTSRVDMAPGTFVLLYPQDVHMPGLMVGPARARVKKVVVKVLVDRVK